MSGPLGLLVSVGTAASSAPHPPCSAETAAQGRGWRDTPTRRRPRLWQGKGRVQDSQAMAEVRRCPLPREERMNVGGRVLLRQTQGS